MSFDYQEILLTWDVQWEQDKAEFLDELYEFYSPDDHCYTGLFLQYQKDLAEFVRGWHRIPSADPRFGKPWLFPIPSTM
jgi:hypothetical protein